MRLLDILYGTALPIVRLERYLSGKHAGFQLRLSAPETLLPTPQKTIVIHGVSVGEINASRQLAAKLQEMQNTRVVIAASTNTGYTRALEHYTPLQIKVVRYPFDTSKAVLQFLDALKPDLLISMELEVWPNMTYYCQKRNIPFVIANGRLSERSFKGYNRIKWLTRPMFSRVHTVLAQSESDASRFRKMGCDVVSTTGNLKWDTTQLSQQATPEGEQIARSMGIRNNMPLVVIGSSGPGEEELWLKNKPENVQLLFAPRTPERFEEVAKLCPEGTPRRSQLNSNGTSRVFLLDTLGELRHAYSIATVCVIGRSFNGTQYGSDPMEPAAMCKPILIGPYHSDFKHAVAVLTRHLGTRVSDQTWDAIQDWLDDPEKAVKAGQNNQNTAKKHQGATDKHVETIQAILGVDTPA